MPISRDIDGCFALGVKPASYLLLFINYLEYIIVIEYLMLFKVTVYFISIVYLLAWVL